MWIVQTVVMTSLLSAIGLPSFAEGRPLPRSTSDQAGGRDVRCTNDNLVLGTVSAEITQHVKASLELLDKDARLRDVAKLTLPCGFTIDPRHTANLFLSNDTETRRYVENNPFGFSLPFGPGDQAGGSFSLKYQIVDVKTLWPTDCPAALKTYANAFELCTSFGSEKSFFGVKPNDARAGHRLLAHYSVDPSGMKEDFNIADSAMHVKTVFFLPLPDASGGTITLILEDGGEFYRAFIDVSRG